LGGAIHHPKCFARGNKKWELTINLDPGINDLKKKGVRVQSNWGLYIPKWEQAKEIADKMFGSKFYKTPDAHICTLKVVNSLYYPAIFSPNDMGKSTIQSKSIKRWNNIEYYKFKRK